MSNARGLSERYSQIAARVAELSAGSAQSGGTTGAVTLIAVSKTQPVGAIRELYDLGHRDFGENYAQELVEKAEILAREGCAGIRWHFIGHLQTNKARQIVPYAWAVHSVDSERLAAELGRRWLAVRPMERLRVFIETNIDREPTKSGVDPDAVPALAAEITRAHPMLELQGLMAIPEAPASGDAGAAGPARAFIALRELEARCRPHTRGALSMGMSADYELALREGATHVRVGTALFGARR